MDSVEMPRATRLRNQAATIEARADVLRVEVAALIVEAYALIAEAESLEQAELREDLNPDPKA